MRSAPVLLFFVMFAVAGCGVFGSGSPNASEGTSAEKVADGAVTFDSLGIDWPEAGDDFVWPERPEKPADIDSRTFEEMADRLETWSAAAAFDSQFWHSDKNEAAVTESLPRSVAEEFVAQADKTVAPQLALANRFGAEVEVIGVPRATAVWKVESGQNRSGRDVTVLSLQTRTAYEVRAGNGPVRVIGVVRSNGLSVAADSPEGEFGTGFEWAEYGASDCDLALSDMFSPDPVGSNEKDAKRFVKLASGDDWVADDTQEIVDPDFKRKCRDGAV